MNTMLVLGGSGFIGKSILNLYLCDKLKKYGFKKIIFISRNIKKIYLPNRYRSNIIFKRSDLTKVKSLPDADVIIHAAESSIKN